jgi:hypothetical protein
VAVAAPHQRTPAGRPVPVAVDTHSLRQCPRWTLPSGHPAAVPRRAGHQTLPQPSGQSQPDTASACRGQPATADCGSSHRSDPRRALILSGGSPEAARPAICSGGGRGPSGHPASDCGHRTALLDTWSRRLAWTPTPAAGVPRTPRRPSRPAMSTWGCTMRQSRKCGTPASERPCHYQLPGTCSPRPSLCRARTPTLVGCQSGAGPQRASLTGRVPGGCQAGQVDGGGQQPPVPGRPGPDLAAGLVATLAATPAVWPRAGGWQRSGGANLLVTQDMQGSVAIPAAMRRDGCNPGCA